MRPIVAVLMMFIFLPMTLAQNPNEPDARVGGSNLRLRTGPGTHNNIITMLDVRTPLTIIGRTSDQTWLEVVTDADESGWVMASYVQPNIDIASVTVTVRSMVLGVQVVSGITDHAREIFARGQELGNRPNVFVKVGDSISESIHMYHAIGEGIYDLGEYSYLQPVIDYYLLASLRDGNSFTNTSLAAAVGWSSPVMMNPKFADATVCLPDEPPLLCEYRINKPAIALIMFGTNDVSFLEGISYEYHLQRIIETSIEQGVIPVVSTIPNRRGFEEKVAYFNTIVAKNARLYDIPLWDYGALLGTLPDGGLTEDGVHPSLPGLGYRGTADFRTHNLYAGYVLRNLSALHVLDAIWQDVIQPYHAGE